MKKILLFTTVLIWLSINANSQTVLFTDSMESGTTNWVFAGTGNAWGLSTARYHSPTHSLTESPTGNYVNNLDISASLATGVDLSTWYSAQLSFWCTYKIESGFDYMYIEVSTDNFATYTKIATFSGGTVGALIQKTYSISGFCGAGNTNVKVRFHFTSDEGLAYDGMYIDDVTITGSMVDDYPPLIVHSSRPFFEGRLLADTLTATLLDPSGISSTTLSYMIDGGVEQTVTGSLISGNNYRYIIPALNPGDWVEYYFTATDASVNNYVANSDTFEFIAGNHIINDNGLVDYYGRYGPGQGATAATGAAVKIALGNTNLTTILIRNYTDIDNPNNNMLVHVWNDNGGVPGTDVITPITITPEATLDNTSPMTRVDLRPFSSQLTGLSGIYYIGFTVPAGTVNITMTQPGSFNRSYNYFSTGWQTATGAGGNDDYHFRAVTSYNSDVEGPNIVNDSAFVDYHSKLTDHVITAQIFDMSGVASADLTYWVDDGALATINPTNITGAKYTYTIPAQEPGAWVKYILSATDLATTPHTTVTDTFRYIAGNYLRYDHPTANYYGVVTTTGTGYPAIAENVNFGAVSRNIVAVLIWNYYDIATPANTPNNDMEFHIWPDDGAGLPGTTELITPITVPSEAGPTAQRAYTRVDLRGVTGADHLSGNLFVGFTVPTGECAFLYDTITPNFGHSYAYVNNWQLDATGNYHIRVITSDDVTTVLSATEKNTMSLYPNPSTGLFFIDLDNTNREPVNVMIYDITGRLVYNRQTESTGVKDVNISSLHKGIYYLQVKTGNEVYNHKIVLE
ncbi:MAG: T9SS type A sorting domain-containing protein [Bacteroidia bacterium]|nr:T9SS type A sorting domain-containing protein [Bacteroidia bacterium]